MTARHWGVPLAGAIVLSAVMTVPGSARTRDFERYYCERMLTIASMAVTERMRGTTRDVTLQRFAARFRDPSFAEAARQLALAAYEVTPEVNEYTRFKREVYLDCIG